MEFDRLIGKLARWAFILHEYDFDIIHRAGRVNRDVDGLNQNPSVNEVDTTSARWHGEVDLETVPGWHAFAYLCSWDVSQGNTGSGNSHNDYDELEGNGALDIQLYLLIMAYLQACEVLMGLTPKEQDWVVHKVKWFKWEGNFLLQVWIDGQVHVIPCPK
jgi:hypothetical protein